MSKISFFVATTGEDDNPGSEKRPFATLQRARHAIRELKAAGRLTHEVTVWIRGGVYECGEPFWLNEIDSGTRTCQVIYSAYPGETPRLSGGRQIPASAFQPVSDASVLSRIQPEQRDKILCADLRALGISDFGVMRARGFGREFSQLPLMLYCNDRLMSLARWPHDGYARTGSVPAEVLKPADGQAFTVEHERLSNWTSAKDAWVHGYWHWDWADDYLEVDSIDPNSHTIRTRQRHEFGISAGSRFYILNLIEELDRPGEWYLDRENGFLYFYPPHALNDSAIVVSMLQDALFSLDNCSFITLRGLTLEHGRDNGIVVKNGSHNLIDRCTLRNVSGTAIRIGDAWNYQDTAASSNGGFKNGISGCEICSIGGAGIVLSGGDRKLLEPADNYVLNNHIHHFSQLDKTYRPAIEVSGVGNRVAHNDIHDSPHLAVWLSGNDHLIEYNRIADVVQETDDAGAIYAGRNPGERGNEIRYNYFRDIGSGLGYGNAAIFLDDGECGVTIRGNIFHRCGTVGRGGFGAIFIHGGRFNQIRHNIFFKCEQAIGIDSWDEARWCDFLSGRSEDGLIPKRIFGDEIDIRSSLYTSRYPELIKVTKPGEMNRINHNLAIRCGRFLSEDHPLDNNNRVSGTEFPTAGIPWKTVLRQQCRLALREVEGFETIPFELIGLIDGEAGIEGVVYATRPDENTPARTHVEKSH
ncbi:right-handed parallel beta-helix repeat-containing protein [Pseudomonadota bacterium]